MLKGAESQERLMHGKQFDVNTNQFGLAVGIALPDLTERRSPPFQTKRVLFPATLEARDAAQSPDGPAINKRHGCAYADADAAVNGPKPLPQSMIGISYHFYGTEI
jgi:hypothetical protein